MEKRIIQVEEKVPFKLLVPLSIQHMFAMFGSGTADERCGNLTFYSDYQGKGALLFGF